MITRFLDVDGALTRCMLAGEEKAPPLLLLHGLTLTSEIWLRNIEALARDFRVVAVDMLGHGFTRPADGRTVGIAEKVAHLLQLTDLLGLDHVAVNGSSYGALIGANLFLAQPERVSRLVISGSGSCFNTESQLAAFVERIYTTHKPTLTTSSPAMWRERLKGTFHNEAAIPAELTVLLPLCYAQPWMAACWEETIRTMHDPAKFRPFRILERLEAISLDTLVVWGRQDRGGIYESAVQAVQRMPRARLIAFDECGHMPMLEHPEQYNQAVRDFLLGR